MESFSLHSDKRTQSAFESGSRSLANNKCVTAVVLSFFAATIYASYLYFGSPIISSGSNSEAQNLNSERDVKSICHPKEPTVLVYNRVPKAGSSSMTNLLSKLSSKNNFDMLGWFDLPSHDYDAVRDAIQKALKSNKKTVIAQHFHFPELVDGDRVGYINVMRNPISRCTSQYYYLRYGDRSEKDREKILEKFGDLSIDDCINSGNLTCFNCEGWRQAIFFCGRDGGVCKQMSADSILERAKSTIDVHYTVGAIEDFEGTVKVMEKLYPSFFKGGMDILAKVKPQRVTKGIEQYIPPSEDSKKVIQGILRQDMDLYKYVVDKLEIMKQTCL